VRKVSFKNALAVMTFNVGSTAIANGKYNSIGFMLADEESSASYAGLKSLAIEELKAYFGPEFKNEEFEQWETPENVLITTFYLEKVYIACTYLPLLD
ncbi:hypothetical protein Tco_1039915, partial [Tanacetum coccineum]